MFRNPILQSGGVIRSYSKQLLEPATLLGDLSSETQYAAIC